MIIYTWNFLHGHKINVLFAIVTVTQTKTYQNYIFNVVSFLKSF
jgi:hypothetical protein